MPPVALVAAIGLTAATILTNIVVAVALTVITTLAGKLLQRKPKKNPLVMDDRTITVRQPLTPRQVVYGAARTGGTIFFLERLTGDDILIGIVWAGHEITAIDSIYADDEQIFINSDGSAFGARIGEIEVYHHLGTDDQLADETFKNLAPRLWTDDHRLRGRAYSAIVIFNLATDWDNNIPNFSASIRGKNLYDPRTNTTQYGTNPALAILDFLTDEKYGYGKNVKLSDIDIGNFSAEANICDEPIALPAWSDAFQLESFGTFTVNTGTNEITFVGIGPNTGDSVYVSSTTTLPAPLAVSTQYWVRKVYTPSVYPYIFDRFLYPTLADAEADTNRIDFTTTGTGTHTAFPSNSRFILTGAAITMSRNATTDTITDDIDFIWNSASSTHAVIVLEEPAGETFGTGLEEGVKYIWEDSTDRIYDYSTQVQVTWAPAAGAGNTDARFLSYCDFTGSGGVDTANDTISIIAADSLGPLYTGLPIKISNNVPSPLISGEIYYAITTSDPVKFKVAASQTDAITGRNIDLTSTGGAFLVESMILTQTEMAGFTTGMACEIASVASSVLPTGLSGGVTYYIIRTGRASFSLAASRADAFAGIAIPVEDAGDTSDAWHISLIDELRYSSCGVYDADQDKGDVLRGLLSSCAGKLIPPVGNDKWKLAVGAYRLPLIELSPADAVDGITLQARRPRRDACNTVKGTFAGPVNFDQPASLPVVSNANYINEDGGEELAIEMNLPFTESKSMGERILKIELERRRKQRTVTFATTLEKGLQTELTDGVDVSWTRFGWINKSFEVAEWNFEAGGGGEGEEVEVPRITLELIEMGPEVYR